MRFYLPLIIIIIIRMYIWMDGWMDGYMYVNYTNNNKKKKKNMVGNNRSSIPFRTSPNSEVVNTKVCHRFQIQNSNSVYSLALYQNEAILKRREKTRQFSHSLWFIGYHALYLWHIEFPYENLWNKKELSQLPNIVSFLVSYIVFYSTFYYTLIIN